MAQKLNKIKVDEKDLNDIINKDPILSEYIKSSPKPVRYYAESLFIAIVQAFIGQLISNKASASIYNKLETLLGEVSEDMFINAKEEDIIACGVYKKKYDQIYNIAQNLRSGILDARDLSLKSDEEVVKILLNYSGIGLWTAEMILMHGLRRTDVLAYGDFGVRSGIMKVYSLDSLSKTEFNKIKDRLSPHGTIASLYFWQAHTKE